MYERIKKHPPVRKLYAEQLAGEGVVSRRGGRGDRDARPTSAVARRPRGAQATSMGGAARDRRARARPHDEPRAAHDACPRRRCARSNEQLLRVPDGFEVHRKLKPFLERRRTAFEDPDGRIDWAHAEALAFASLLRARRAGAADRPGHRARHVQPAPRGAPRRRRPASAGARSRTCATRNAPFELHNSPLSEQACLGFEYGYSVQAPGRARALGGAVRRLRRTRPR